ncbi:MAG: molybdopterin-synthase adenylyltransferase MoeB [Gammaproteobacteria bacterium]|nr:molybdopterin-synthase adenylyltransferase MoeB [Gammaproteobacteria bacterium]MBT4494171.1 molybdopterin-synthase adenylyltransferase MoeB [Gammaproteobacteria bacterium]
MNDEQLLRYSRHIMLPEIDIEGQEKLLAAKVLIIGLGGLGSPVSLYLAASGVGSLTLADFDEVDLSNLQRQIVHTTDSLGEPKPESAKRFLHSINPEIEIRTVNNRMTIEKLDEEIERADIVVDCTDNFEVRYAINDACLKAKTILVSGAAVRMEGQLMVIDPTTPDMPCYRCLYQDAGETELNCATTGIAAPVVGAIGTLQALETLKLIVGIGESLAGYLLTFDAKYMDWRKLKLPKNPHCVACSS